MSKKQKIKSIRCYQSVYFEKKMYDSFTTIEVQGRASVNIKLDVIGSNTDAILISSDKDSVHVPLTNVSGIYYYNKFDEHAEELKKAEKAAKASNAKSARDNSKRPM